MTEHAAPTAPGPAVTPHRRRWWPFGLLSLGLVLGICAISGYAARQHPAEPAPAAAAPVKAADVAAPLPAKPCHDGVCATPPADNPPARVDGPATPATRATTPPARVGGPATRAAGSTFAVDGVVELKPGQFTPVGATDCAGSAGFGDIGLGTPVTVTDAAGVVVAVAELDLAMRPVVADIGPSSGPCDLQFTVAGIPAGRGYYGVEVADR